MKYKYKKESNGGNPAHLYWGISVSNLISSTQLIGTWFDLAYIT